MDSVLTAYILSRWECESGCGIYERGTIATPLTTCPRCGRGAKFLLSVHASTTRPIPFSSSPRLSEQQIRGTGGMHTRGGRQANGKSTGRPPNKPRAVELPPPPEPKLPGTPPKKRTKTKEQKAREAAKRKATALAKKKDKAKAKALATR